MPNIIVTIPLEGLSTGKSEVAVDADGFIGPACRQATDPIVAAIGRGVGEQVKREMVAAPEAPLRVDEG